jgi:hypothetical protein
MISIHYTILIMRYFPYFAFFSPFKAQGQEKQKYVEICRNIRSF